MDHYGTWLSDVELRGPREFLGCSKGMKTPNTTIPVDRSHSQTRKFEGKLLERHRDKLHACGLNDPAIDALGFYSADDDEGRTLLRWDDNCPWKDASGLAIPYLEDPDDYTKVRLDNPPPKPGQKPVGDYDWHGGFKVDPEWKPETGMKYAGPVGLETRPYLPLPLLAGLPNKNVLIVEGELKAASAACWGQYAVGIAGVWNAHDPKAKKAGEVKGQPVLKLRPELAEAIKDAETVTIGFDSPDMVTKPQVIKAAVALARMCMDAGKRIFIAYIPQANNWDKVGLDDYLAALPERQRSGALQEYMRAALPVTPAALLKHLRNRPSDQDSLRNGLVWAAAWFGSKKAWSGWRKQLVKCEDISEDLLHAIESKLDDILAGLMGWNEPLNWLTGYMEKHDITYTLRGQFVQHGQAIETKPMVSRLRVASANASTGIKDTLLTDALNIWIDLQRKQRIVEMQQLVSYDPSAEAKIPVANWLKAVTGKVDPVEVAVVRHWIWSIKRKLHGLPVIHHIMPVIVGKTGSGKSVAVEKLLAPVRAMCAEPGDMTILADDRQLFRLAEAFVCFFDEMARCDKTDVESLKRVITSPTLEWRLLGSHVRESATNNATFIGCSNRDVNDIVYDPTSARRFYQLRSLDKTDWDAINAMDMKLIWKSVEHLKDAPIKAVLAEVQERQEGWRAKSTVEEWVDEVGLTHDLGTEDRGGGVAVDDLYAMYKQAMDEQGRRPATKAQFRKELVEQFGSQLPNGQAVLYRSSGNAYRVRLKLPNPPETSVDKVSRALSRREVGAGDYTN